MLLLFIKRFIRPLAWIILKQQIRRQFPTVQQLSTKTLANWLDKGEPKLQLIDTRNQEEFLVSHLPNAKHLPDLETAKSNLDPNVTIVAYCSVGYRSSRLAEQLQQLGYPQVWNLEGSIFQWANEGRILKQNGKPTQNVHPYSKSWQWLLKNHR